MEEGDSVGGSFDFDGTDRFEIRRRIGAGGMGVVYEAYDRENQTRVALKTLRRLDPQGIYRFKKEFRALQDLAHPNLVRFRELIQERGQWFLTMELVHGVDILRYVCGAPSSSRPGAEPILADGPHTFDEVRLREAMGQLALGLAALHEADKVHRDIKPSNILVTRKGRVVLLDFGLMTHLDTHQQSTEAHIVGTAIYMAPEQAATKRVGPEADWYSFGVVLYEALTGRVPFTGTELEILMDKQQFEPPRPSKLAQEVPPDLEAICVDLLKFDPNGRPSERRILDRFGVAGQRPVSSTPSRSRFTQTMPFVGREDELLALDIALDATARGQMSAAFVVGESGMGKSELVRRFVDRLSLKNEDAVVLSGRCFERETVPYKAFDGIADSLSRHMVRQTPAQAAALLPRRASLLGRLFPVLRRVPTIASAPMPQQETLDPQELRTRMFRAFRELLQRLAERECVVLCVDDFQWADADSLTMMAEVFHRPDPPAVLLVATARTARGERQSDSVAEAKSVLGSTRTVELGSLPPSAARQLVELLIPVIADARPDLCDQIAQEARGHPLFIQEIVRYVEAASGEAPASVSLEEALWSRIARLGPDARLLLEILAVAGAPLTQELAAAACRLEHSEFEKAVAQLRVAFLARTRGARGSDAIETYHDRIRNSVLAKLDDEKRKKHHGRVAVALERAGFSASQPQLLVRHLEAAGETARAAQLAEQGAVRSFEALAFDRAARLYGECLRLGSFEREKLRDLRLRLGQALVNAGRGARAADALIAAADGADPTTRMECRRQAAEQLLICGHIDRGIEVVSELLAEIGTELPATPKRALMHVLWSRTKLRLRGLRWKERHEKEIAESELARLDVYKAVGVGLNMADTIRGADFQARHLLLALKTGEPQRIGRALAHEACYLSTQGKSGRKRASVLIEESKRILDRAGDDYLEIWVRSAEGLMSYFAGQFSHARACLLDSETILRERTVGNTWELNTARLFLLFTLRHLGEIGELRQRSDDYMRDARRRGDLLTETSMRRVRNIAWLALGRPDRALRDLERTAWIPPEGRFHLQHWYELESLSELALYQDQGAEALEKYRPEYDALSSSLLNRIQIVRAISRWLQARLALAAAEQSDAPARYLDLAKRNAKLVAREDAAFGEVWAGLLRAAIAVQEGDEESALTTLRSASEAASLLGMSHCVAAAQYRRGELTGGDVGQRLVEQAEDSMRDKGVVATKRRAQIIAPGFKRR